MTVRARLRCGGVVFINQYGQPQGDGFGLHWTERREAVQKLNAELQRQEDARIEAEVQRRLRKKSRR